MKHLTGSSVRALCVLLILVPYLRAGLIPGVLEANEQTTRALNVVVVEGEGTINNIKQKAVRDVVVKVEDRHHGPVSGVFVLFSVKRNGAGGSFLDGLEFVQAKTDANGIAIAHGFHPNELAGAFQIGVTATYQGLTAETSIKQTNVAAPVGDNRIGISNRKLVLIGAVSAAALIGILAGVHSGSGDFAIAPGKGTVGAPK